VTNANANDRKILDMVREFSVIRSSSIELIKSMTPEMTMRYGIANDNRMSVRAMAYMIVAHEVHHRKIIEERYIGKF
jgi:hypothetical protein